MKIDERITPAQLQKPVTRLFELAADKVRALDRNWDTSKGTPVFTIKGKYATRGWTEWTQGFQYGCAILSFDATREQDLLEMGRRNTVRFMAPHVTHTGVHDHGFNNLSTYGNLRRLMREKAIAGNEWELAFYEMAIKASGAVQAARWAGVPVAEKSPHAANSGSLGYIYSFNGPQSLFVDTMRTVRILGCAWQLGHKLMHENDRAADLLKRSVLHGLCTSRYIRFSRGLAAHLRSCGAGPRTKQSSTATTATSDADRRSRGIRRSAPGRAGWRGRCSAMPRNSSFSRALMTRLFSRPSGFRAAM